MFDHLPTWPTSLRLVAYSALGALVGLVYFQTLRSNARRLVSGGGIMMTLVCAVGRFALVGAALALASRDGATVLLGTTTGILAARHVVLNQVKVSAQ